MTGGAGVDALLFDLGNVVVPLDFTRAFASWARSAGVPTAQVAGRFAFDDAYRALECGEIDESAYYDHLRATLGIALDDAAWRAGWNAIFLSPDPATGPLLEELSRRHRLYLFSNTNRAHQAFWAPRYDSVLRHFTRAFVSCELGLRKPDAAAFLRVAELIGVPPERIAFFDDLEENVQGARRAGLRAYTVAGPADIRRALA